MDFKQIKELIKLVDGSNISEVKIEQDNTRLTIRTNEYGKAKVLPIAAPMQAAAPMMQPMAQPVTATAPTVEATPKASNDNQEEDLSKYITIKSPMVGTFYRSPSPDKPAFIAVGDTVKPDTVVCIIEAMKLFNDVESEVSGKIVKVLVDDSSPIEYDQPLFLVDPS